MRPSLLLLALLAAPLLRAQDPLPSWMDDHPFGPPTFASTEDSLAFTAFRQGLVTVAAAPVADSRTYRQLWREVQHGGRWSVARGDASGWAAPTAEVTTALFGPYIPFRTADGRRGWMVVHDIPCAMVCRSAEYYVEVTGR